MDYSDALETHQDEEQGIEMITLMTGTPGSGKSYDMSSQIYWAVRRRQPVVCNFEVNREMLGKYAEYFIYVENDSLSPELLSDISKSHFSGRQIREGSLRLYIDECSIQFGSRSWNDRQRPEWIKFFMQHRKLGYDVYLITQFDTMIDKQLRALIEYEVKHRKLNNVGWVGKLASVLFLGHPVFCCVRYWYPMKERLSCEWLIGRKKFYRMYDTYTVFNGQEIGEGA